MSEDENLELSELNGDGAGELPQEFVDPADFQQQAPSNAKELEAVYDIPVQVSAVLGRATMQVSQLLNREPSASGRDSGSKCEPSMYSRGRRPYAPWLRAASRPFAALKASGAPTAHR